jgi:hypothetical protein
MAFWEFLIQKEGDRSWLPLESAKVEILEGRYRIVAHSNRSNAPVEIRIVHDATAEIPPMRRTQKRVGCTNQSGLVAIMPFTRLLPGIWELRCTSDLMADMLGEGWQHMVRLQVLPVEADLEDDWDPDWSTADLDTAVSSDASPTDVADPTIAAATVDSLPELDTPARGDAPVSSDLSPADSSPPAIAAAASPIASEGDASDLLPLADRSASVDVPDAADVCLRLEQEMFILQRGQMLTLSGQIETSSGQPSDRPVALSALQIRLYDPRTSEILVEQQQPLAPRSLPLPFTCEITLPDHFQTYLVLGDILLYGGEASTVLVTQPFSVTTALHELLEAIANDVVEADLFPPPSPATPSQSLRPELLDPAVPASPVARPVEFQLSSLQPLPPQLYPSEPTLEEPKPRKTLDLPSFDPALVSNTEEAALADGSAANTELMQPLPSTPSETAETATTIPVTAPIVPQAFENEAPIPDWERSQPISQPQPPVSNSPEDIAFRSLNLQERFWSRLQSLVADRELVESLQTWAVAAEAQSDLPPLQPLAATVPSPSQATALQEQKQVTSQELSAEKAHTATSFEEDDTATPDAGLASMVDSPATMPVLPIQTPIPMPQLQLPDQLTAGQLLTIPVTLPPLQHPLLVKLWLVDRQSRAVLDGPHWLSDFAPTSSDQLTAHLQVTVPYGCLEAQFEAIALEMATQRESDKITAIRPIVPPDEPTTLSEAIDELDLWER